MDLSPFISTVKNWRLRSFLSSFQKEMDTLFSTENHGDYTKWASALQAIYNIVPPNEAALDFKVGERIVVHRQTALLEQERDVVIKALKKLHPWRKGPFELFDIFVDSEWQSGWKWERLKSGLSSLEGKTVLDIGCGNGYHLWHMAQAGARSVLGIDPMLLFAMQFKVMHSYSAMPHVAFLPIGVERLPKPLAVFDTVFSMGVLYHRRSPIDHIYDLKSLLKHNGELVLETLVIDGPEGMSLVPPNRYAKMRNVWFLPSISTLEGWLKRCGFKQVHIQDVSYTTTAEQRKTEWMTNESLADFLSSDDPKKTVEGLPAPKRAVFICKV